MMKLILFGIKTMGRRIPNAGLLPYLFFMCCRPQADSGGGGEGCGCQVTLPTTSGLGSG